MTDFRFDGQVAIVTGAGGRRNLGRAYAMLLAARGAKVVVNDINAAGAERVAKEIVDAGGEAVADTHDISQETAAHAVVENALDSFGRIDLLVNNAGAMRFAAFDDLSSADVNATVDSHLKGAIWLSRAAWPHFRRQKYGRIVMVLSTAAGRDRWLYYTVKAGLRGLNYSLAWSGAKYGIKCNGIIPLAATDSIENVPEGPFRQALLGMQPEQAAPVVAALGHERCPVTGEEFLAIGGGVTRYRYEHPRAGLPNYDYLGDIGGYRNANLSVEDIYAHWDEIIGADYAPLVFNEEFGDPAPEAEVA